MKIKQENTRRLSTIIRTSNPRQQFGQGCYGFLSMPDLLIKYSQLGDIFDFMSLGVIILSIDSKVSSMNRSAEILTGRAESEVLGKYCYDVFSDYLCGGKCRFLENRGSIGEGTGIEITDNIDGKYGITKIDAPIYDPGNRLVGQMEVFHDLSSFKELIRRIRFDDLKLKLILDNLDIGVMTVDRGSHVSFLGLIISSAIFKNIVKIDYKNFI